MSSILNTRKRHKSSANIVIAALLTAWGIGTCYGFWHFEGQYLRPVGRPAGAAVATPDLLPPPPVAALQSPTGQISLSGPQPVTVLNFWNPRCACARYAEGDVRKLIRAYGPQNVRFVTVIACGDSDEDVSEAYQLWAARSLLGTTPVADRGNHLAMKFGVWADPAAVILDRNSRVAYVGGYNAARFCSNPATAWGAKALSAIVAGQKPPRAKTVFFGCQLVADQS